MSLPKRGCAPAVNIGRTTRSHTEPDDAFGDRSDSRVDRPFQFFAFVGTGARVRAFSQTAVVLQLGLTRQLTHLHDEIVRTKLYGGYLSVGAERAF